MKLKPKRELSQLIDYGNDMESLRCSKRRCLRSGDFKLNHCRSTGQRISDNAQTEVVMEDIDYMNYLKFRYGVGKDDDESLEDEVDPDYKMFLDHSREDGTSYIFEMTRANGMYIFLKYEEENDSFDEVKNESPKISGSILSRQRRKPRVTKELKSEFLGLSSIVKYEKISDKLDESYCLFLSCVRVEGASIVLETEDGVRLKYEDGDECLTDSEVLATEITPNSDGRESTPSKASNKSSFKTSEDDWSLIASPDGSEPRRFRKKLMSVLKMPYDQAEYDKLWTEAITRKPLQKLRDLRGRLISYATERKSFSYLDYHDELKEVIESAGDDRISVLYLLRGFFFWLKNVAHAGAFEPWLDELCLKAMLTD